MNKQELLDEINKTKEHSANMEKMLAECEHERWKPSLNEEYFTVSYDGVNRCININEDSLDTRYDFYNCFQTQEQAEAEAEKILVRRMLEDIARKLNKGKKIDWTRTTQVKYSLILSSTKEKQILLQDYITSLKGEQVYCLDEKFKDVAIQEIGEERLKKYLRGE